MLLHFFSRFNHAFEIQNTFQTLQSLALGGQETSLVVEYIMKVSSRAF